MCHRPRRRRPRCRRRRRRRKTRFTTKNLRCLLLLWRLLRPSRLWRLMLVLLHNFLLLLVLVQLRPVLLPPMQSYFLSLLVLPPPRSIFAYAILSAIMAAARTGPVPGLRPRTKAMASSGIGAIALNYNGLLALKKKDQADAALGNDDCRV